VAVVVWTLLDPIKLAFNPPATQSSTFLPKRWPKPLPVLIDSTHGGWPGRVGLSDKMHRRAFHFQFKCRLKAGLFSRAYDVSLDISDDYTASLMLNSSGFASSVSCFHCDFTVFLLHALPLMLSVHIF